MPFRPESLYYCWIEMRLIHGRGLRPLLTLIAIAASFPTQGQIEVRRDECVVLLHGLFRTAMAMKPMEWYLEEHGYFVVNNSYPSLSHPIEELAEMAVGGGVQACAEEGLERIHFVTHSLGGIILRQFIEHHDLSGLRRVVMLGPPNQGSQIADYLSELVFLDPVKPEAITQLGTGPASIPLRLGPVKFELGVVAGTFRESTWLPGFPETVSDGTVSVAETIVPGMADFLQLPVTHTFMIWNPEVMEQVAYFLEHGAFRREE